MNLQTVNDTILTPALRLLPGKMASAEARLQLLATGYQESKYLTRVQVGGPARSFWQIEEGGGLAGVLRNAYTGGILRDIAKSHGVPQTADGIFNAYNWDDLLGAVTARLILWLDPHDLPPVGSQDAAWACYLRNWRPGVPRPADWPESYSLALGALQ